jgi:hypothetical protein
VISNIREKRILFLMAGLSFSLLVQATGPDYTTYEAPPSDSVEEPRGLMTEVFMRKRFLPSLLPRLRDRLKDAAPFWRDAGLALKPRTYYLDSQRDSVDSEAWALGGALEFRSGWWRERLRAAMSLYTTQKVYGPQDRDGTLLLAPGQQGFTVLGEAYLEAGLPRGVRARAGRMTFNLPYLNRQDNRMVPNTFEAYGIGRGVERGVSFVLMQVDEMKKRDSDRFESMSEAAGLKDSDKSLSTAGVALSSGSLKASAINHYAWDFMNTFYAEANLARAVTANLALSGSLQMTDQRSVGDELDGNFDAHVAGVQISTSYRHAILRVAYTSTDDESGIRSPFGGYPGYASIIVKDFDRAGENAWLVGLSYKFTELGMPGLSAFINYAEGDTPDRGAAASPDQEELDITVDYHFQSRLLKGLWLRGRAAFVDQDNSFASADDVDDYRLIVNYELPIL